MKSKISWNRVASSNLASSSKELRGFDFGVLSLLQRKTGDLIPCAKDTSFSSIIPSISGMALVMRSGIWYDGAKKGVISWKAIR
jgi:hypothetical protein